MTVSIVQEEKANGWKKYLPPLPYIFLSASLFITTVLITATQCTAQGSSGRNACQVLVAIFLVLSFIAALASASVVIERSKSEGDCKSQERAAEVARDYIVPKFSEEKEKAPSKEAIRAFVGDPSKTPSGSRFWLLNLRTRYRVGCVGLIGVVASGILLCTGMCAAFWLSSYIAEKGTNLQWTLVCVQVLILLFTSAMLCGFLALWNIWRSEQKTQELALKLSSELLADSFDSGPNKKGTYDSPGKLDGTKVFSSSSGLGHASGCCS